VSGRIVVSFATRRPWAPSARRLARWAHAALGRRRGELSIRIVTRSESRRLNRTYRGRDYPTNVLSFPAGRTVSNRARAAAPLGDLAVCADLVAREARLQGKPASAHWAHMVVHGTLHVLGYDHERPLEAKRMERRERAVLARLGFADPYRSGT
jgi:probable rRNA maturation factor